VRILFLGQVDPGQTSLMRLRALKRLGHEVQGVNTVEPWLRASWFRRHCQKRLACGSVVDEINARVVTAAREFRPDLVWAEKQEFLRGETLEALRRTGARLAHFTPDPYFSLTWKRTRLMDEAIRQFDVLVFCKSYERKEYAALGRPLVYMPLGYCDETHRPLPDADARWQCQVGFLGGWEPRRQELLAAVAATGVKLKIWGGYWDFVRDGRWTLRRHLILRQLAGEERVRLRREPDLARALQGGEVYGDDYARALTGAKMGVGFLRRVCPDQHTTRTFEIPAAGSLLLADRTDEHREFFEEGTEAEFFGTVEELVDKVRFYTANEPARAQLAAAGRARCIRSGYAYVRRLEHALAELQTVA
jgi:hypothetical protein